MTAVLRFDSHESRVNGKRLRRSVFVHESAFPLHTACAVANTIGERFAPKLGQGYRVDLFEPVAVTQHLMDRILPGATAFSLEASGGTLWLVLSAQSVAALVSAAFGATEICSPRALSMLETQTLHTMAQELARLCAPIYGEVGALHLTHDYAPMYQAASYFEIRIQLHVPIYIGVLLARDPGEQSVRSMGVEQIAHVPLTLRGIAGRCNITLSQLGALEIGDVLPMIGRETAQLITGSAILAQGTCGIANGRNAFLVEMSGESTIS